MVPACHHPDLLGHASAAAGGLFDGGSPFGTAGIAAGPPPCTGQVIKVRRLAHGTASACARAFEKMSGGGDRRSLPTDWRKCGRRPRLGAVHWRRRQRGRNPQRKSAWHTRVLPFRRPLLQSSH
jgi:hypothetical protein